MKKLKIISLPWQTRLDNVLYMCIAEMAPYKFKKKECCPCKLNETLTFTENRRISGKKRESGKRSAVALLETMNSRYSRPDVQLAVRSKRAQPGT